MLDLPEERFARSVKVHNVCLQSAADWIEGSVLFGGAEVSKIDVKDSLLENEVYGDQDFAAEFLDDVWLEFSRRARVAGARWPLAAEGNWLRPRAEWKERPAYTFCLVLSLMLLYRRSLGDVEKDYSRQGELFERLVEESLIEKGWNVLRTGWSHTRAVRLGDLVQEISDRCGERVIPGGIEIWTEPQANDAGLDVLCLMDFQDDNGGRPLFLFQCASGSDWERKRNTPDLNLWRKIVDFSNSPQRGLAIPFSLSQGDFRRCSNSVDGFVLDRFRLFAYGECVDQSFPSCSLSSDLIDWLTPRCQAFPRV